MRIKNFFQFVISLFICLAAGAVGSVFTRPEIAAWYAALNKPVFNPPNWLFGPAWTLLYILMGISFYLIWRKGAGNKKAKIIFIVHLVFNALWSILFFGLHQILFAFVDIVILWLMIVFVIWQFSKINRRAAYLLIPYLAWVSFASILNLAIYLLN